ncbi:MAG: ABC transporter permease [Bacteroidales bacterium]
MIRKIKNLYSLAGRNKATLITNILGLSIGLATAILLMIFIFHEWSYDRNFSKADNIYRLHTIWKEAEAESVNPINLRQTFTEIPQNVPGIETTVQIYRGGNIELIVNNIRYAGNRLLYVDSTFFSVFDFEVLEGSAEHALNDPNSVVLTRKTAVKIFGDNPAVGQVMEMGNRSYTVSAVTADIPVNTHFTFDLLMPMNALDYLHQLGGLEFFTYYLFDPNADHHSTGNAICEANTEILTKRFSMFGNYKFSSEIEPLKRLHLFSNASYDLGPRGSINTVILVGAIAVLVMFLALTNFVNLFVIEGEQRAKEIGIKKVNGARRKDIIIQFFTETTFIVGISFVIGLVLATLLLPQFGDLMRRQFSGDIFQSPILIITLISVFILTVVFSGSYPALYLSRLKPAAILKPQAGRTGRKKIVLDLAGGLQLVITLVLLTYLFGINNQIQYMKNLSPGFTPQGLVNIFNLNDNMKSQYPEIHDQLLNIPEVDGVAASFHTFGGGTSGQGIRLQESPSDNILSINEYRVQPGLCRLLELELKEGRFFDPELTTDRQCVIINEAAEKMLGLPSAVGRSVVMFENPLEVIGVVKDFHYESAAREVQPLVMTTYSGNINNIVVRLASHTDRLSAMEKIEHTLKSFDEDYIFTTSNTLDIYQNYYAGEERLGQIIRMGAAIAVIIVMMGIFMLVSQSISRRTKEIGIRKVLGGSTLKMLVLLYYSSLKWIAIASVIAMPVSYFMLDRWLQNYAVKASVNWWLFVQGIIIVLVLETIITIGQTWRVARRNPVESIRYE